MSREELERKSAIDSCCYLIGECVDALHDPRTTPTARRIHLETLREKVAQLEQLQPGHPSIALARDALSSLITAANPRFPTNGLTINRGMPHALPGRHPQGEITMKRMIASGVGLLVVALTVVGCGSMPCSWSLRFMSGAASALTTSALSLS